MQPGADYRGGEQCNFLVWAPLAEEVVLKMIEPAPSHVPMQRLADGYWQISLDNIVPGTLYKFVLDGEKERPDPASHWQPQGVHGPSAVVDHSAFPWTDDSWRGRGLEDLTIYELHVGTFTPEGTFDAIISRLQELVDLGVSAIELMPVAAFPGTRNWGYDGVQPFAAQNSYGGPNGLKRLVDAAHSHGMAVLLDVVYNHLGPEGNYLWDFGPYFTDRYHTPWGNAVNFDGPHSDEVRRYFLSNSRHWFEHYHIDGLRIDAVHAIRDFSATPFLQELAAEAQDCSQRLVRPCLLIAESDLNDPRLIRATSQGGFGLDGQWSDDFHHALHTLLTSERHGYYADFGRLGDMATAFQERFVYAWRYSSFRKRHHGAPAYDLPAQKFVVCSQNHDQVGNRMRGERLISLAGFEGAKLAAAAVILSPYIPLFFMGEEFAADTPFPYFVSFGDAELIEGVRRGRREEFPEFHSLGEPPDPQAEATFQSAIPNWGQRGVGRHGVMLAYYRDLLRLRGELANLRKAAGNSLTSHCDEEAELLWLCYRTPDEEAWLLLNFSEEEKIFTYPGTGFANLLLDSAAEHWAGAGSSLNIAVAPGESLAQSGRSAALYHGRHPEPPAGRIG